MRILLLGLYYSNNLGDAVICDCVAARLREHFPEAQVDIRDFMDRHTFPPTEELPIRELDRRRRRMKLRRWASAYLKWDKQAKHEKAQVARNMTYIQRVCQEKYDLAIFAGGQIFADGLALYLEAYVRYLSQHKIPILFNAVGVGPTASSYIRRQLSAALSSPYVRWISSRDDIRSIYRLYVHQQDRVVPTFDPALWCADVYHVEREHQTETVGLGIMYTHSVSPRIAMKFWIRLIRALEKEHVSWKIFVNGSSSDVVFAKEVLANLPECVRPLENYLTMVPHVPVELVKTLAGFKSIISFRLHSHIIAAALDIPSVAVVWDNKVRFFFKKIGHPERCCTVFDRPSSVLKRLKTAELEGYDHILVEKQKSHAEQLLCREINSEMNRIERLK